MEHLTNRRPSVPTAQCRKCGRQFFGMPADGRDHYFPANERVPREGWTDAQACMGEVTLIEGASPHKETGATT